MIRHHVHAFHRPALLLVNGLCYLLTLVGCHSACLEQLPSVHLQDVIWGISEEVYPSQSLLRRCYRGSKSHIFKHDTLKTWFLSWEQIRNCRLWNGLYTGLGGTGEAVWEGVWCAMGVEGGETASWASGDSADHTAFEEGGRECFSLLLTQGSLFSHRSQRNCWIFHAAVGLSTSKRPSQRPVWDLFTLILCPCRCNPRLLQPHWK